MTTYANISAGVLVLFGEVADKVQGIPYTPPGMVTLSRAEFDALASETATPQQIAAIVARPPSV